MHDPNSIAIILPAYNEEITIAQTIKEFHEVLPHAHFVVIDNNSNDKTAEIAQATFDELNCKASLLTEKKQGKANAVRKAFSEINADLYLMADADQTYPASEAPRLMQPIIDGEADMTVGDRLSKGIYREENTRPFHNFGNWLMVFLINLLFSVKLNDIMSGYRCFSRRFVKTYPILVGGFELETDLSLHALDKRLQITEIPVAYKDRPENSFSKLSTLWDGTAVLFSLLQIIRYYKPFLFFGSLSFCCMLLGFAAGYPVLQDWFLYKFIHHLPLLCWPLP